MPKASRDILLFIRIGVVVCLTWVAHPVLGQETENDPQAAFVRGRELIQSGRAEEGLDWMRRAATNGLLRAQGSLMELLLQRGDEASRAEGLRWALLAGRRSDPISQRRFVSELRPGDPASYYREAWPWLERMAERGDPATKFQAGIWAFYGYGGLKNLDAAYRHLFDAAGEESFVRQTPQVCFLLGYLSENGFGTAQNYAAAAALYWRAAENGWPDATYRLGLLLEHGQGVAVDAQSARLLYVRAAELGIAAASYRLGLLENANGSDMKNRQEAYRRFLQAATNGLSIAQTKVALYHEKDWLNQGANPVEALAWYRTAATCGNRLARIKAENLERNLSAAQRAEVEARVVVIKSTIRENVVAGRPGENLLPESLASRRNDLLKPTETNPQARPRRLSEARLKGNAETNTAPIARRNDLEAGLIKPYLDDLQNQVWQLVRQRWADLAQKGFSPGLTNPEDLEIILSYRLLSDGRVEDVELVDSNLDDRTAALFFAALEDSSPTARWLPRLRAELTEEYQDLLLAFGRKSVLRISQ
jgi:TPR repeat protein